MRVRTWLADKQPLLRWGVRLFFLAAALVLAAGGPLPSLLAGVFPGASPLAVLGGGLAGRAWYAGFFWGVLPLFFLALAVWRGRFFCRWVCPTGTLYEIPRKVSLRRPLLRQRLNGILFWAVVSSAVVGAPLFLVLDPLAAFSRPTTLLSRTYTAAALIPGLVVPVFFLVSFVQPALWCTHLCPLGYMFDLSHRNDRRGARRPDRLRRSITGGLLLGIPVAAGSRLASSIGSRSESEAAIMPPGAENQARFAGLCSRCYACVNVCPTKVIGVHFPDDRAVYTWFQPQLMPERGYCEEFCNRCTQVCPTGALKPWSIEEKRGRQIGVARVRRTACLGWADGQHCMVCQEFCPYHAIDTDESKQGIPRPVVRPDVCRGCGVCQNECPAIRDGVAIVVRGQRQQKEAVDA